MWTVVLAIVAFQITAGFASPSPPPMNMGSESSPSKWVADPANADAAKLLNALQKRQWDELDKAIEAQGSKAITSLKKLLGAIAAWHSTGQKIEEFDLTDSVVIEHLFRAVMIARKDDAKKQDDEGENLFWLLGDTIKPLANTFPILPRFVMQGLRRQLQHGPGRQEWRVQAAAEFLIALGLPIEANEFLRPLDDARRSKDFTSLELHALQLEAARDSIGIDASAIWALHQEAINQPGVPRTTRNRILRHLVELLSIERERGGRAWLKKLIVNPDCTDRTFVEGVIFQSSPIGRTDVSDTAVPREMFVEVLAENVRAKQAYWGNVPKLMAKVWSSDARAVIEVLDRLNNLDNHRMIDDMQRTRWRREQSVDLRTRSEKLSEALRGALWLEELDEELIGRLRLLRFRLTVAAAHPFEALSDVESLLKAGMRLSSRDADQLLAAWTMKGPDPVPGAAQPQKFQQLAELVSRLRARGIAPSENALVDAFAGAHSPSEPFREWEIESVLGPLKDAGFTQDRLVHFGEASLSRLTNSVRRTSVQRQARRNELQRKRLVADCYEDLDRMISVWCDHHPVGWEVKLLRANVLSHYASFLYDENGEKHDLDAYARDRFPARNLTAAEYSREKMDLARTLFQESARALPRAELRPGNDRAVALLPLWFEAEFRASRRDTPSALASVDRRDPFVAMRNEVSSFPAEVAAAHWARLVQYFREIRATTKPDEIHPFLERALQTVPTSESGMDELRRAFTYHGQLASQVRFSARIDGDQRVSVDQPFAIILSFRHTRKIEEEQGGFGRYLATPLPQQSTPTYGYQQPSNDPVINYKGDFVRIYLKPTLEKAHYELLETRFYDEDVAVRDVPGDPNFPRETPFAYILIKATDAALDLIPSIHFDLDFDDGLGKVILPAKSEELHLDLRASEPPLRPVNNLLVKQTLSPDGPGGRRLCLEVKAEGFGSLPEKVGDLLEIGPLVNEIAPVSGAGFDPTTGRAKVERTWCLNLSRSAALSGGRFTYPTLRAGWTPAAPMSYLYRDPNEDLEVPGSPVTVEPVSSWVTFLVAHAHLGAVAVIFAAAGVLVLYAWPRRQSAKPLKASHSVTMRVLSLLHHLAADEGPLSQRVRQEVRNAVTQLRPAQDASYESPVVQVTSTDGAAEVEHARIVAYLANLVTADRRDLPEDFRKALIALLPQIEGDCFASSHG